MLTAHDVARGALARAGHMPREERPSDRARRSLIDFTQHTYPQYLAEPVHRLIAAALDRVVTREITRLMIVAPPQHGKSELFSVRMPAYWLGRNPDLPVIVAAYGADLAYSKSRQARAIVESSEYRQVFSHIRTRADSRAVDHWELASPYRGGLLAAGVGGPITGHGAGLGIIDDPFANWEQAQSRTIRDKVWEWYRTTFRTRIWEGGAIVIGMTRWNEDDLAGRLLNEQGDAWTVLRLPAIAETQEERDTNNAYLGLPLQIGDALGREAGEALAPRRYSIDALLDLKRDVGSIAWSSEYQGVPRPAEGGRFKRHWFNLVEASPRAGQRVRYWDKAGTKNGGAATAGVLMLRADDGWYIEDVVKVRESAYEREMVIKQTAQLDADRYGRIRIFIEQEPGSGGKESAEATIRNLAGYMVYADLPTGDKDTRLEPFAAQAEAGNVRLVRGTWNHDYIEEMLAVPHSTYRDQADATAGAFNKLATGDSSSRRAVMTGFGRR